MDDNACVHTTKTHITSYAGYKRLQGAVAWLQCRLTPNDEKHDHSPDDEEPMKYRV